MAVLRHRYGSGIDWSLAMIGLAESGEHYVKMGYTGVPMAQGYARFSERYGMPVTTDIRERPLGTWPACRVVIAARLHQPDCEAAVHRALQVAWFTTTLPLDGDAALESALAAVPGIDAGDLVAAAHGDEVTDVFNADLETARSALGSPTEAQGKTAMAGERVRYTAPSLIATRPDGTTLEAGGFQPLEAYDVIIANADPTLARNSTDDPLDALAASEWPLATAEVAAVIAKPLELPDRLATELLLIGLAGEGKVNRIAAGNGAFWAAA